MSEISVDVRRIDPETMLSRYCFPGKFLPLCRSCPDYARDWSCPPGTVRAASFFPQYRSVYVVGMKVTYSAEERREALDPDLTDPVRQATYGRAKAVLRETMLALEEAYPGSLTIMAGRCEVCTHCSRELGVACVCPEKKRISFSALEFDLSKLTDELLHEKLLWCSQGLPEYDMAIAAFLTNAPDLTAEEEQHA